MYTSNTCTHHTCVRIIYNNVLRGGSLIFYVELRNFSEKRPPLKSYSKNPNFCFFETRDPTLLVPHLFGLDLRPYPFCLFFFSFFVILYPLLFVLFIENVVVNFPHSAPPFNPIIFRIRDIVLKCIAAAYQSQCFSPSPHP